jgi:hypothetical protein
MRVNNSKCAPGLDKFGSVVDRMYMKLGSKFLSSLRVMTPLLKRLQYVCTNSNSKIRHELYVSYTFLIRVIHLSIAEHTFL